MKKLFCMIMVLVLLASLPLNVFAATGNVVFTGSSSFRVGGTAQVDLMATCQSVMDSNCTSDMYNAALERNVDIVWVCSGKSSLDKTGQSVTWSAADAGQEFVCRVGFYADRAKTEFVDYIDSIAFTIEGGQSLKFITTELHDAVVGEEYYAQVATTDSKAVYSEFMGSELSSFGLTLHSNGIIDGTPTKAGNCHINIVATGPSGEDSASYDLTVMDAFAPSVEVLEYPNQTTYMVGDTFNPEGMRVKITTFDGSILMSENGQYLEYTKQPLKTQGDVKIKLKHGDAFTFVYITVVPASGAGGGGDMPPSITMDSLPTAYVGEEYYVRIYCGDLDAEFWEYYNPGKPNDLSKTGLKIMKNGVLTGVPTKAGSFTFTICAGNDNGEDYATYTLVVKEAPQNDPTVTEPADTTDPETPTELTEPTDETGEVTKPGKDKTDKEEAKVTVPTDGAIQNGDENSNDDSGTTWVIVGIILGVVLIGLVVLIILLLKRKKA